MPQHYTDEEKKRKKKRLSKFSFEDDGCAVALVSTEQGGPANGITTLLTKSTKDISEEDLEKAEHQLEKNSQPSVKDQGEDVVKTEGKETDNVKPEEEVNKMTEENKVENPTQDDIQAMITKALKDQEADIRKAVEAEYEDKHKQTTAQLEVLKAKEEAREEKAFINKAAEFKEHLGAEEDKQADAVTDLAKALRKMEADEDCKPAVELLKSLKETVEKSALLDEVGGASPIEKSDEYETEGDKLVMKMVKEEGVSESDAYAKLLVQSPHLFK